MTLPAFYICIYRCVASQRSESIWIPSGSSICLFQTRYVLRTRYALRGEGIHIISNAYWHISILPDGKNIELRSNISTKDTDCTRDKSVPYGAIISFPRRAGACSRRICPGFHKRRALQGRCGNQALRTGQCPVPTNRCAVEESLGGRLITAPTMQLCILHEKKVLVGWTRTFSSSITPAR